MRHFTRRDVDLSFSPTILSRGYGYMRSGQVIDAWYDEFGDLTGRVRGSGPKPYRVHIELIAQRGYTKLESECTCPFGEQCKHGAALAYHALVSDLRSEESADDDDDDVVLSAAEPAPIVIPEAPPVSAELSIPHDLSDWIHQVRLAAADAHAVEPSAKYRVFYRLQNSKTTSGQTVPVMVPFNRSILKAGGYGVPTDVRASTLHSPNSPKHWTLFDQEFIRDLYRNAPQISWEKTEFRLDGKHGIRLLREVISTRLCFWVNGLALRMGETRSGKLTWETSGKNGALQPKIVMSNNSMVLATVPPWYVDLETGECGPVECGLGPQTAATLIRQGPIQPEHVPVVQRELSALGIPQDLLPASSLEVAIRTPMPTPCFAVDFEACSSRTFFWGGAQFQAPIAFGNLTFEYDGVKALADGSDMRVVTDDAILIYKRNPLAERYAKDALLQAGWQESVYAGFETPKGRGKMLSISPKSQRHLMDPLVKVEAFAKDVAPKLTEAGWKIQINEGFRFVPDSEVEWDIALDSASGIDWFEFKLGICVEGEPFDLKSILATLMKEQGQDLVLGDRAVKGVPDDLYVFGLKGCAIKLSRQRVSAILQPLIELFGGITEWPEDLRLPKAMAPEISKFEQSVGSANVPWRSTEELQHLRKQFAEFDHLEPLPEPAGFVGKLRPYQQEGLAWLQFLREFNFAGILADDMGLGKTVQILAHIQTEKAAGRLDRPCLIVAPTSTMPNWRRESEKFAPELKVITLQGSGRSTRFAELNNVDIALTTYPLLARDKAHLLKSSYHIVVLDEAQNIKNPVTAAAKAARELEARHRVCLSGTPVENHLGELWALFQFLMPGFLGSDAEFKKRFRNPIEKSGDPIARGNLAQRIRPFMLRRTKSQVVQELPPKTEIVETVAFEDPQRDLYESVRIAMDEQVRNLIAKQGFDKSRIQILDALLKLRQICCDPRLVKLPSAKSVSGSAKLDRLMEMLQVLVEDGRKVLVFSQFTSMLDLIEARLREAGIQWVRISGDTVDRETPVKQFQAGNVPLFLISLKAGGTGLNLTAADTVILYDPWWNPAVENQAIDRAHRIGQEKAVIVYKMVASGTIEEKMLEMQAKKGDIAKSILTDDADGIRTLTADDLRWVLSSD